jgi:hypothetical protein
MTSLALPTSVPPLRVAPGVWLALALLFAGLVLPDCCLNGRHAMGSGMDAFGAICHAIR